MRAFFEDNSILAFFTDRHGGVSKVPYESLNVSDSVEDKPSDIIKNRQIIADNNDFLLENMVYMEQIHSANIKIVTNSFVSKIRGCDGIITDKIKIPLMTMAADCAPVLVYDKGKKIIAALHSGRVGTFKGVISAAIYKMRINFGSLQEDIVVHVGPSIAKCCYEIDESIANFTIKNFGSKYISSKNNKYFLDIKSIIKEQLISLKLLEKNIRISDICTSCDKNYFSYRRDGLTGRFCGIIMLK